MMRTYYAPGTVAKMYKKIVDLRAQLAEAQTQLAIEHAGGLERESVATNRIAELEEALEVSEIKNDLLNKMCERNEEENKRLQDVLERLTKLVEMVLWQPSQGREYCIFCERIKPLHKDDCPTIGK